MVDIQIASLSPRGETGAYNAGGLAPRDSIWTTRRYCRAYRLLFHPETV